MSTSPQLIRDQSIVAAVQRNPADFRRARQFFQYLEWVANRVVHQTEYQAGSSDMILAIDFCEIVDRAHPFQARSHSRSELRDIAFSSLAVDILVRGEQRFTILPGTVREIRAFLKAAMRRSHYAASRVDTREPDDSISGLFEALGTHLALSERVAQLVLTLLNSPSFVHPRDLGLERRAPTDRVRSWKRKLQEVRARKSHDLANQVDAENLAAIENVNQRHEHVLQLLTRTRALHKIETTLGHASFGQDLFASMQVRGRKIDILIPPPAFALWKIVQRGSPADARTTFHEARAIKRLCSAIESELSELVFEAERTESIDARILKSLEELQRAISEPAYRNYVEKFVAFCMRDVDLTMQIQADPERIARYAGGRPEDTDTLHEEVMDRALTMRAVETQALLIQLWQQLDFVSRTPGGTLAMSQVLRGPREARGIGARVLEDAMYVGFPVPEATTLFIPTEGSSRASGSPAEDIEMRSLFGATIYRSGRWTVFWAPSAHLPHLVRTFATGDQKLFVSAIDQSGALRAWVVTDAASASAWLAQGPFETVQMQSPTVCFTWEATKASESGYRRSFCSLRGDRQCVSEWVTRLKDTLPVSIEEARALMRKAS